MKTNPEDRKDISSINRRLCIAFTKATEEGLDSLTLEQFKKFTNYKAIEQDDLIWNDLEIHGVQKNRITIDNKIIRQTKHGKDE